MKVSLQEILALGEERKVAIPAFNVYNLETLMGVKNAAEETGAPVIFQIYSRLFENQEAIYLAPAVLKAIEDLKTPAAFHIDHGSSNEAAVKALRLGVTGVMRDASTLPFEENVRITKEVVDIASAVGVGVEGELGHVGTTKEEIQQNFTEVEDAVRFVEETGVTALAVMVGTAHGRYKKAPVLGIQRIAELHEAVNAHLVLHGGSGVPEDQVKAAVKAGIRKVNYATDVCYSFLDAVSEVDRSIVALDIFMREPVNAVKNYAIDKIRLLGADTK